VEGLEVGEKTLNGRCIVAGETEGEAIVTKDAISFMGTVNPKTGYIIERKHEIEGECLKGKILVFPCSKGSTGGSYMLYDVVKNRVGPVGIINREAESVVTIGAIVANLPMVDHVDISQIKTGDYVYLNATDGVIRILEKSR
jgi:predicted aconitase with swiveling domain